jgi:hypothetical protein
MDLYGSPQFAQQVRRATTATSILDVGAWIGLCAGLLFWANFFWLMIEPALMTEMVQAMAMAAAYSVVLPMLLSTLVPSTPAGMLLQQTRWKTVGFIVTIGITGYLAYHALTVLWAYWASRPNVLASGQDLPLAIGSLIIFVFVPALAWVQAAPDRWVAEVQAAMAVRKLKMAHEANIMAAKTQYLRNISLLRRGIANLSAQEQRELAEGLVMFQRAENEAIGTIVDTLESMTGISTGVNLIGDDELERAYTGITQKLAGLIAEPNVEDYVEAATAPAPPAAAEPPTGIRPRPDHADRAVAHQDAAPALSPPPAAAAEESSAAALRRAARRYAAEFRSVAAAYPPPAVITSAGVAEVVEKSDRTAREMIAAWLEEGWVARGEAKNSYYITNGGRV